MSWTYFLNQNTEDQLAAGQIGARRDLHFFLWARTNTNRVSLTPGQLFVENPPPDMSDLLPEVLPIRRKAPLSPLTSTPNRETSTTTKCTLIR